MGPLDDIGLVRAGLFSEHALSRALTEQRRTGVDPVLLGYLLERYPRLRWLTAEEWTPVIAQSLRQQPKLEELRGIRSSKEVEFRIDGSNALFWFSEYYPGILQFSFAIGGRISQANLAWVPWTKVTPNIPYGGSVAGPMARIIRYVWDFLVEATQGLILDDLGRPSIRPMGEPDLDKILKEGQSLLEEDLLLVDQQEIGGLRPGTGLTFAGNVVVGVELTVEGPDIWVEDNTVSEIRSLLVGTQVHLGPPPQRTFVCHTTSVNGDPETIEIDGVFYRVTRED